MGKSVVEAIRAGVWDFEPLRVRVDQFASTEAMPGSEEKLRVIAERVEAGLPLWHELDRRSYDDEN